MGPLINWWIPYAVYKRTDGSPTLCTNQLMDPLRCVQINWWIPYAVYISIDGFLTLHKNQLMDPLRYIQINWWIPYTISKSIDGFLTLYQNHLMDPPTLYTNPLMNHQHCIQIHRHGVHWYGPITTLLVRGEPLRNRTHLLMGPDQRLTTKPYRLML